MHRIIVQDLKTLQYKTKSITMDNVAYCLYDIFTRINKKKQRDKPLYKKKILSLIQFVPKKTYLS